MCVKKIFFFFFLCVSYMFASKFTQHHPLFAQKERETEHV